MILQEILATERRNTERIYLHREGVFWKLYEQSAFAFIHRISRYRATKRFVKYLDTEVVTIGFPDASRAKVLGDRPILQETEELLLLETSSIDSEEYENWKQALPLASPKFQSSGYQAYTTPAQHGVSTPARNPHPVPDAPAIPRVTLIEPGGVLPRSLPDSLSKPAVGKSHPAAYPAATALAPPALPPPVGGSGAENILRELRDFSIENATPLECLLFVSSLKKQLHGNL